MSNDEYTFNSFYIPKRMMPEIKMYVEEGIIPGDFLQSVISNDLFGVLGKSDNENMCNLLAYVVYFFSETPSQCWGSREKMKEWSARGGLNGIRIKNNLEDIELTGEYHADCNLLMREILTLKKEIKKWKKKNITLHLHMLKEKYEKK